MENVFSSEVQMAFGMMVDAGGKEDVYVKYRRWMSCVFIPSCIKLCNIKKISRNENVKSFFSTRRMLSSNWQYFNAYCWWMNFN